MTRPHPRMLLFALADRNTYACRGKFMRWRRAWKRGSERRLRHRASVDELLNGVGVDSSRLWLIDQ